LDRLAVNGARGPVEPDPPDDMDRPYHMDRPDGVDRPGDLDRPDDIAAESLDATDADTSLRGEQAIAWLRSLRVVRRAAWALPSGALVLALTGVGGVPGPAAPTSETGRWLVLTLLGLVLMLVGAIALTALLAMTTGRRWALLAMVSLLAGTVLFVPVLGLLGVARPVLSRLAERIDPGAATDVSVRVVDGALSRWLGLGGLALVGAGWLAFGCAVLAAGMLNRFDGVLVLVAVAVAVTGATLSWQFLFVVAAMVMVAAGLGLAFSAWRLTPDGRLRDEDASP
jgi:hypothetical protein